MTDRARALKTKTLLSARVCTVLLQEFRAYCAYHDLSMADAVGEALRVWLDSKPDRVRCESKL